MWKRTAAPQGRSSIVISVISVLTLHELTIFVVELIRMSGRRGRPRGSPLQDRDVVTAAPGHGRKGRRSRIPDIPNASRRTKHRDVGLAITIVVAGHRDVGTAAPGLGGDGGGSPIPT